MGRKSKKTFFKEMRWAYMIFAVIALALFIGVLAVPKVLEAINESIPKLGEVLGEGNVKTYLAISFGLDAILNIWYFYLITRCAEGKSKGILLIILLALQIISSIIEFVTITIYFDSEFIIAVLTLFALIRFKSENK